MKLTPILFFALKILFTSPDIGADPYIDFLPSSSEDTLEMVNELRRRSKKEYPDYSDYELYGSLRLNVPIVSMGIKSSDMRDNLLSKMPGEIVNEASKWGKIPDEIFEIMLTSSSLSETPLNVYDNKPYYLETTLKLSLTSPVIDYILNPNYPFYNRLYLSGGVHGHSFFNEDNLSNNDLPSILKSMDYSYFTELTIIGKGAYGTWGRFSISIDNIGNPNENPEVNLSSTFKAPSLLSYIEYQLLREPPWPPEIFDGQPYFSFSIGPRGEDIVASIKGGLELGGKPVALHLSAQFTYDSQDPNLYSNYYTIMVNVDPSNITSFIFSKLGELLQPISRPEKEEDSSEFPDTPGTRIPSIPRTEKD